MPEFPELTVYLPSDERDMLVRLVKRSLGEAMLAGNEYKLTKLSDALERLQEAVRD